MSEDILDLNEFLERVQNDQDLLLELLDIFVADFQEKRVLLAEAIEKKDYEQIRGIAHSLKGASGNISAKVVRQTFIKLEDMGKRGDMTGAAELLSALDQQFKDFLVRISTVKNELKG